MTECFTHQRTCVPNKQFKTFPILTKGKALKYEELKACVM